MSAAGPPRRGDVRVVTLNLWGGYYPLRRQVIGRMRPGGERPAAWTARQAVHPDDPGHTFTPDNPLLRNGTWPQELGRRIDYVTVRCRGHGPSLDIAACERVFDQPVDGVWATDHFGVVAHLTVPPREPAVTG